MNKLRLTDRHGALVALTVAGVIWGLTVPLTKLALDWLDPAWLAAPRFGGAPPAPPPPPPVPAPPPRGPLGAAWSPEIALWGAIGFGGVVLLQNAGIQHTSVSHAALIV